MAGAADKIPGIDGLTGKARKEAVFKEVRANGGPTNEKDFLFCGERGIIAISSQQRLPLSR